MEYSGSNTFKYIDKLIRRSKSLLIISPFIGNYYAEMLAKSGKRALVITSDDTLRKVKALRKGRRNYAKVVAYFVVLDALIFYLHMLAFGIAVLLILIAIVFLAIYSKANIVVKSTGKMFVHEKMYIGDKEAIIGSANLTFSGTHRNIEHIEIIDDMQRIEELRRHFYDLWRRY
ncbi:MAG: phospholipase D-like domain-containing protein [Candidatus Micrarchaeia archaeon]